MSAEDIIKRLNISGLGERFFILKKMYLCQFFMIWVLFGAATILMLSFLYFPKYSVILTNVMYILILPFIVCNFYLAHKMQKMKHGWKLFSTKTFIVFNGLPLTAGMLLLSTATFWSITEIAKWPLSIFSLFVAINSVPFVFVILEIIFLKDTYSLAKTFPAKPEDMIRYLESDIPECCMKKNILMGSWSASYGDLIIKIVPLCSGTRKKSRVIIEKICEENLNKAIKVLDVVDSFENSQR